MNYNPEHIFQDRIRFSEKFSKIRFSGNTVFGNVFQNKLFREHISRKCVLEFLMFSFSYSSSAMVMMQQQ